MPPQAHIEVTSSPVQSTSPTPQVIGSVTACLILAATLVVGLANAGVFKKRVATDYWGRPLHQ